MMKKISSHEKNWVVYDIAIPTLFIIIHYRLVPMFVEAPFHINILVGSLHPDEAVAYGAAVQAGILSGEGGQDLLLRLGRQWPGDGRRHRKIWETTVIGNNGRMMWQF